MQLMTEYLGELIESQLILHSRTESIVMNGLGKIELYALIEDVVIGANLRDIIQLAGIL